jgi:acid phosphatase type 7
MLRPGAVHERPKHGQSQAHPGIYPLSALTTKTQKFQPLPTPLGDPPYHYDIETAANGIRKRAASAGKLVFHVAGDTGGINNPQFQMNVAAAMSGDLQLPEGEAPEFFYHLGDVVYFNGQVQDYYAQFYDPYKHYTAPILAIPGNHDGDPINSSQTSLDGWVRYFMNPKAMVEPESKDAPRVTLSLPNVYYTLNCPFVTIIGMYTNVPEGGSIDSVQQQWLTNEFATAPADQALILALHHPVYSFDTEHSGSARMADAVQAAINDTRRVPNMVLMGHVHNYQRIERDLIKNTPTPFLVIGYGGYPNLHKLNASVGHQDPNTQAVLKVGDDKDHGYAILTVDGETISGVVKSAGTGTTKSVDTFSYPATAQHLPKTGTISL